MSGGEMALARFRFRRLAAAIGIGLLTEALLMVAAVIISSELHKPWGDRIASVTQEPAYHLINWFAVLRPPGFEEQAAYAMLIPLLQWVFWSVVIYLLLSRTKGIPVEITK
jgi:hypothetical protein